MLPPPFLAARLTSDVFQRESLRSLPALEVGEPGLQVSRRSFLGAATASLALFAEKSGAAGQSQEQLIFSPKDEAPAALTPSPRSPAAPLRLGDIPADFWERPRELWLRRQGTRDEIRVVYWQDGRLLSEGYWQACALLRDVRANLMTTIDPTVLDVLRGITGFYQAWRWPHPLVATSGFRTAATNRALASEGAARNSMHLYGKAVDLYIPGIPTRDVGALAMHLRQGGVGFYPSKGFTHLDTGKLRSWSGR